MGLGHALSGAWVALLALAIVAAMVAVSSWLVLRELV
jgi:hypothetical protein